jgi:hypothetical protein
MLVTDVSKKHSSFVFRVLQSNTNQSLKTKVVRSTETSLLIYKPTQRNITEDVVIKLQWNSVITTRKGLGVVITEESNVMVNSEKLIGTAEYLSL